MKKVTLWILLTLICLIIGSSTGLVLLRFAGTASSIHHFLTNYWWAFALWRYLILGAVIWQWPALCHWYGNRHGLSAEAVQRLTKRRWWLLAFIVIFEAIVVYGV